MAATDAPRSRLREKGQITIPQQVREELGLRPNDEVLFVKTEQGYLLRRGVITDPDQAWFWTPEWQAKEREADEDLAAGRFTRYDSDEEFLAALDERDAQLRHQEASS